jgi:Holliday junction resolvase RusA-like endonuclease
LKYSFLIDGKPKPKERPRMTRRGRTYTPKATLEAEQRIRDAYSGPLFTGPVAMYVTFEKDHTEVTIRPADWTSGLRGDIDNYVKTILDGLQGKAFDNDRQVVHLQAAKA